LVGSGLVVGRVCFSIGTFFSIWVAQDSVGAARRWLRATSMSRMLPKAAAPNGGEVEKGDLSFRFCGCLVQI